MDQNDIQQDIYSEYIQKMKLAMGEEEHNDFVSLLDIKESLIYVRTIEENRFLKYLSLLSFVYNYAIVVWDQYRGARLINVSNLVNNIQENSSSAGKNFVYFKDVANIEDDSIMTILDYFYDLSLSLTAKYSSQILSYGSNLNINWESLKGLNKEDYLFKNIEAKEEWGGYKGIVFVMLDFYKYLVSGNSGDGNLICQRVLRALSDIEPSFASMVITGNDYKVPRELEPYISNIEFKLPNRKFLSNFVNTLISAWGKNKSNLKLYNLYQKLSKEDIGNIVDSGLGLTHYEFSRAFKQAIYESENSSINIKKIQEEKKRIVSKSSLLEFKDTKISMEDVGGLSNLREWLTRRKCCFSENAKDFGINVPKGVLLTGYPGSGKSLICQATANEWSMPLLRLDMGCLFGSLVGESEANMRDAINIAEATAPCVLWIDEIEKSVSGTSGSRDGGTTSRVFASFLTWLQEKEKPVFVIATANDILGIPPEMVRAGRFDEIFFVDLPNKIEREEIFKVHLNKKQIEYEKEEISELAKIADGYSGSEIEKIINNALIEAFYHNREVSFSLLQKIIKTVQPLSKQRSEQFSMIKKQAQKSGYIFANE